MTPRELERRLQTQRVVTLSKDEWTAVASAFPVQHRHTTGLRGDLLIVRTNVGPAAVEEPKPHERVVRLFDGENDIGPFVTDRLAAYERMWDGCGCRIDYYS